MTRRCVVTEIEIPIIWDRPSIYQEEEMSYDSPKEQRYGVLDKDPRFPSEEVLPQPRPDLHNLHVADPTEGGGLRYNAGKPRFDLMPPEAMVALATHYQKGAEKYADRNWERGMAWGKCFASLQRHAWAWQAGEDYDEETGSHHMISVAWNAIALFIYAIRGIGTDDRHKVNNV